MLELVRQGLSNKAIARALGIGLHTARGHVSSIKQKTGMASVAALPMADLTALGIIAPFLSPTEATVLQHLCTGISSKRIARLLGISPRTVDKHRQHLLTKFGLHSTRQLLAWVAVNTRSVGWNIKVPSSRLAAPETSRVQLPLMPHGHCGAHGMTKYQEELQSQIKTKKLESQLAGLTPGRLARMTTAVGQVTEAINAGTEVVKAVTDLKDAVVGLYNSFEGAKEFAERSRSLELLLINGTGRRLVWKNSFFDSGVTFTGPMPMNVETIDATLWTVASSQGGILTGVSGAGKWTIEGTPFSLVIGFTNPQIGTFKNQVGVAGRDVEAKLAYDASENIEAKQYDSFGFNVSVTADEAKLGAGRRFVFCITEAAQEIPLERGDTLKVGEYLTPGQYLISRNGRFTATYQAENGKLVVNDLNGLRKNDWVSSSSNHKAYRCGLDQDGVFAAHEAAGVETWKAPATAPGGQVKLGDDGVLYLYDSQNASVWKTR